MQTTNYIGVTGVSSVEEVREVRNIVDRMKTASLLPQDKKVMLGYLVSQKTLNDQHTENRRYPLFKDLPAMLEAVGDNIFTMIHYNSREFETLAEQVSQIFDFEDIYEKGLCKAFQLNMAWPDPKEIEKIKSSYPEIMFVLSLTKDAISGNTPAQILEKTEQYHGLADYILIDPSGGEGKPFDIEQSADIYRALRNNFTKERIVFAGGFDPDNISQRLETLIDKLDTTDFSIDAEKGLRIPLSQKYGDDLFSAEMIEKYLTSAAGDFKKREKR
ncbi:MAG: hypothetical protein KAR23_03525 [Candidatus Aenigmarchaeota archaeon]|nr:hypothetical protein [Candidatus Aenigmarchaeota archaeon]